MGYITGEGRNQGSLFPVLLDELIPEDHACRVIEAFVGKLDVVALGFERARAADTGRPGYDPRDLIKLYLYGYLQQLRSTRRLEAECRRNVELMWLLGRLAPDHKAIAEFRKVHSQALTHAGAQLIGLARSVGLLRGGWVAVDGSKFRTVSSARSVGEREALRGYLRQLDEADAQDQEVVDHAAAAAALAKIAAHPEPEARFMRTTAGTVPAYNLQAVVDTQDRLIVVQQVTTQASDNPSLEPMARAAQAAVAAPGEEIHLVADAGYSNGEQAKACEDMGVVTHIPANRAVNNQAGGQLFDRGAFVYDSQADTYTCPAAKTLRRSRKDRQKRCTQYAASARDCLACPLKPQCTRSTHRLVTRHFDENALERMHQRATPEAMRLRRTTVELAFADLKYKILGLPRLLLRGTRGAQAEMSIAVMAYNLKRMIKALGAQRLTQNWMPA